MTYLGSGHQDVLSLEVSVASKPNALSYTAYTEDECNLWMSGRAKREIKRSLRHSSPLLDPSLRRRSARAHTYARARWRRQLCDFSTEGRQIERKMDAIVTSLSPRHSCSLSLPRVATPTNGGRAVLGMVPARFYDMQPACLAIEAFNQAVIT